MIVKKGVQDTNRRRQSPVGSSGGIVPRKILKNFEHEILGNGISGILRSSHCFVMSAFFAIRGLNQMPLDLPHNNGS